MKPNSASAKSPSERMRMKKTPMIALKSVKTLPATIDATERLVLSSTGPSLCRRFAASSLESPPGCVASVTRPLIPKRRAQQVVAMLPGACYGREGLGDNGQGESQCAEQQPS